LKEGALALLAAGEVQRRLGIDDVAQRLVAIVPTFGLFAV
jgi:hypothetical protein